MSRSSLGNFLSRSAVFFLLVSFGPARSEIFAQAQLFKADLVTVNGKNTSSTQIEVVLGADAIELRKAKEKSLVRAILYSTVVNAEYTYSYTPTIGAGAGGVALLGLSGLPLFFNSKKRNWLTINAGENSALLDLRSSNYRTLLLQLQQKKIPVTDLGDKNTKKKPGSPEKSENSKPRETKK